MAAPDDYENGDYAAFALRADPLRNAAPATPNPTNIRLQVADKHRD